MALAATQKVNLNWANFASAVSNSFRNLRNEEDFCDVTLACNPEDDNGQFINDPDPVFIKAHK